MNEFTDKPDGSINNNAARKRKTPKIRSKAPKKKKKRAPNPSDLFACDLCSYLGTTKKYLARHKKLAHQEPTIKCEHEKCPKLFHFRSKMLHHLLVHTGEKPYKCEVCGKAFNSGYTLKNHSYIHTDTKPFACGVCDYACRDGSTLRKHRSLHSGDKQSYQCKECGHTCKSKRNLKLHVASKHLGIDLNVLQCGRCERRFRDRSALGAHIKKVHERSHAANCPVCGLRVTQRANLQRHMVIHGQDRPYKCSASGCDKSYKDSSSLRHHSKLHHVEAQLPCQDCGRRFTRPQRLANHRRKLHGPVRKRPKPVPKQTRHECDICGFVSRNKPGMVVHIKCYHTYAKICRMCKKTFTRPWRLQLHYSRVHGIEYKVTPGQTKPKPKPLPPAAAILDRLDNLDRLDIKEEPADDESIDLFEIEKEEPLQDLFYEESESDSQSECGLLEETSKRLAESELSVHINDIPELLNGICAEDPTSDVNHSSKETTETTTESSNANEPNTQHEKDTNKHTSIIDKVPRIIISDIVKNKNISMNSCVDNKETKQDANKSEIADKTKQDANKSEIADKTKQDENKSEIAEKTKQDANKSEIAEKTKQDANKSEIAEKTKQDANNTENADKTAAKEVVYKTKVYKKREPNPGKISKEMAKSIIEKHVGKIGAVPDAIFDELFIRHAVRTTTETKNRHLLKHRPIKQRNDGVTSEVNHIINDNSREDSESDTLNTINDKQMDDDKPETSENNSQKTKTKTKLNSEQISTEDKNSERQQNVEDEIQSSNHNRSNKTNNNKLKTISSQTYCDKSYVNRRKFEKTSVDDTRPSRYNTRRLRYNYNEMIDNGSNDEDGDDVDDNNVDVSPNDDQWRPDDGAETSDEKIERNSKIDSREARIKKVLYNVKTDSKARSIKVLYNSHQCSVCFKIYETKAELIDHCKDHFDICNSITIKKCPLCDYVSRALPRHMKLVHKINITRKYNAARLKDRKDNSKGSRYYVDLNHHSIKEIEVIPSVKNLNKIAGMNIDKRNREAKDKQISKDKLVKKKEWVVEKEEMDVENVFVPKLDAKDTGDKYMLNMRKLYFAAKKEGKVMMFPCRDCDKICQTYAALKLHSRKHDPNKKPFKTKVWKHKIKNVGKNTNTTNKITNNNNTSNKEHKDNTTNNENPETNDNTNNNRRDEKPKPIVNKHKCAPELKSFYENCIRGGDIEFWQFLKIYNKMGREDIKDFIDLEKRKDFAFGLHTPGRDSNKEDANTADEGANIVIKDSDKPKSDRSINDSSTYISTEFTSGTSRKAMTKSILPANDRLNKKYDKSNEIRARVKVSLSKTSQKRVVKLSKQEFLKREQIKEALRKKIAASN